MSTAEKVRENRLRREAARQGLNLVKAYGARLWFLIDTSKPGIRDAEVCYSLDEVEQSLERDREWDELSAVPIAIMRSA